MGFRRIISSDDAGVFSCASSLLSSPHKSDSVRVSGSCSLGYKQDWDEVLNAGKSGSFATHSSQSKTVSWECFIAMFWLCIDFLLVEEIVFSIAGAFKGCGMGTLFVVVSPSFRENVVVACKIGSFLCSLDNLLQKNVIVFFFGNQISKWRSFEKRGYFWPTFHIFSHQGKVTKIPSAHISLTYTHVFCSPYWLFLPYQFWKKKYEFIRYGFSLVWVLVLILIRAILEQSINNKMVSKI